MTIKTDRIPTKGEEHAGIVLDISELVLAQAGKIERLSSQLDEAAAIERLERKR